MPVSVVQKKGFAEASKVGKGVRVRVNPNPPSRGTVMTKIHKLYETEKAQKEEDLAVAEYVF